MIKRELWGHGYASEALGVMIDEAWSIGLDLLTARAHADNDRSTRLLSRLGFREVSLRPVEIRPGVTRQCRFFELRKPYGRET
jgi:RimJ/RimL family protein N-acetyltransferase